MSLRRQPKSLQEHHMNIPLWLSLLALTACSPSQAPEQATTKLPTAMTAAADGRAAITTTTSSLARYHWQLHDAVDGNNQRIDGLFDSSGKPLQLDFTDEHISVSNACNGIGGNYKIVDGQLVAGPLIQTMMACADPTLMQREKTIKKVLQAKPALITASADGKPLLSLSAADGTTLSFVGQPTAGTRYDGPGTIEFLEVAADPTDCPHPLQPAASCIKVRELHYDAHGLRVGEPGAWQTLTQPIEGYEHQHGVRNVLRVKRYALPNPPADTSPMAYVLDMIVESETIAPGPAK
jgi:heat shock protein HslJ